MNLILACHETSVTEISVTDNGDGTYDYNLEVCMGSEDTYGFELTFNGANLISAGTNCITSATTGETICATIPSSSGTGDIEYGDYDDTGSPVFHELGDGQQCFNLAFTLDSPAADVEIFGTEESVGFCGNTGDLTSCFGQLQVDGTVTDASDGCNSDGSITADAFDGFDPYSYSWDNGDNGATISNLEPGDYVVTVTDDEGCVVSATYTVSSPSPPDYTVELTTGGCNGNNEATWEVDDPDGNSIGSAATGANGTSTFTVCGCGATATLNYHNTCTPASLEVFDVDGNSLGTTTVDGGTMVLDCLVLPVELKSSGANYNTDKDINKIIWKTSSEQNNDYFTVEYSSDEVGWMKIGETSGAGNTSYQQDYEFIHTNFRKGIVNYYKISQTDFDGKTKEISVLSVNNISGKKSYKTVNMMGQEVNQNSKGVVVKFYDDGTTEKVYRK